MLASRKESYDKSRQCIKNQRHHFAHKGLSSEGYGLSSSHVQMWVLDHKEEWEPKNWCFQTVMLDKILESLLDSKEIKPVILQEINSEYSLEGLMLKLKLQYFGHLMWRTDSWCWERLKAKGEEGSRGWDGCTASLIQRTWTGANSGRQWGTRKLGVLHTVHGVTESDTTKRLNNSDKEKGDFYFIFT